MELNEIYNYLIEMEIVTEGEIELVTTINGYSEETLNDIIYVKSGYHDIEQYLLYEDKETYNEYFGDSKEEEEEEEEEEED